MPGYRRAINLTKPANQEAILKANAAVPVTKTTDQRKQWIDAYIAAGGEYKEVKKRECKPGDPVRRCPCKPITSIVIKSITLLSDHKLLKNYDADWRDGGSRYPKPEWTSATQHPVSHTMNEKVKLKVEIEVGGPDACTETGDLLGEAPNGMTFAAKSVSFKPGTTTLTLTSDANLAKKIQELNFNIKWSVKKIGVSITPATTKNLVFVTMGTPKTQPRRPGITFKRMRQAVKTTSAAASLDPHKIVAYVMSRWGSFNLSVVYDNAWELADDTAGIGADCQTIVRYTQNIIDMVGCPGTSEFIVVWAKVPTPTKGEENPAYVPNVSDPIQWYNSHNPPVSSRSRWRATLVDHGGGQNRYEACLRFTQGGVKKYYAGGVGEKINANQVIKVFKYMAWRHHDTAAIKGIIHSY